VCSSDLEDMNAPRRMHATYVRKRRSANHESGRALTKTISGL